FFEALGAEAIHLGRPRAHLRRHLRELAERGDGSFTCEQRLLVLFGRNDETRSERKRRQLATLRTRHVQWPARSAAASITFTFGPSASRKLSSSSSSMIASPKPAAISIAVAMMRRN